MESTSDKLLHRPFDYIHSGGAGRLLDNLFQHIQKDRVVNDWLQHTPQGELLVKSDLKFRVTRTRRIRIRRLYWSLQRNVQQEEDKFSARTLVVEPENEPRWFDFPNDPTLTSIPELLSGTEQQRVLQYVPLRRLTILNHSVCQNSNVIKLKREGRAKEAAYRLKQINRSLKNQSTGFALPIGVEPSPFKHTYQQSFCPGISLGELLQHSPYAVNVEQLGYNIALFHNLTTETIPASDTDELAKLADKLPYISALWPSEYDRVLNCYNCLRRKHPHNTTQTLCHGDLSLDNILVEGNQWSLIDLDLAHRGNPMADIAQFLVRLKTHSIIAKAEYNDIRNAFLTGYQTVRPTSVSTSEMHWHSCRAELDNLYIALRKDIGTPHSRASSLVRAERHCRAINQ